MEEADNDGEQGFSWLEDIDAAKPVLLIAIDGFLSYMTVVEWQRDIDSVSYTHLTLPTKA